MKSLFTRWRFLAITLALILVASLGGALAAAQLIDGEGQVQQSQDTFGNGGLLATSRSGLEVCVDDAEGAELGEAASTTPVTDALSKLTDHPKWEVSDFGAAPPVVEYGCPSPPYLSSERPSAGKPIGDPSLQSVVKASEYRVFVFVMPDSRIAEIFGSASIRTEPQEILCMGETCAEVTTGLYVGTSELKDPSFLETWLARALGLESATPEEEAPSSR